MASSSGSQFNLNTLASSLPSGMNENAEKDLLNNFKAAALSITTLYRSSRQASKQAYTAGYVAACQDLLGMIQQGVSLELGSTSSATSSLMHEYGGKREGEGGLTIGRVMDWIEARLDAIKARKEEEEEEEERETTRAGKTTTTTPSGPSAPKETISTSPVQPSSPSPPPRSHPHTQSTPPPSAPPPSTIRPIQRSPRTRPTLSAKADSLTFPASPSPAMQSTLQSNALFPTVNYDMSHIHSTHLNSSPDSIPAFSVPIGGKRKHAVMMMRDLDSPSSSGNSSANSSFTSSPMGNLNISTGPTGGTGAGRRRRGRYAHAQNQNAGVVEGMLVDGEEEGIGRERKRVARR